MSIGLILLAVVSVLILFGVAQRVLDRLRLSDQQALVMALSLFVGGLIGDIPVTPLFSVNLGGALIPLLICLYLLIKCDSARERIRTLIASALTGVTIYALGRLLPNEPEAMLLDANWLYGLAGGLIAWLFGRSRRGAFIAGILGAMIADVWSAIEVWQSGVSQKLALGGAGAADVIVLCGLIAVLTAELVGEILERLTRGTKPDAHRLFDGGDFHERRPSR